MKYKTVIFLFLLFGIICSILVSAQVVQTQVIELTEKVRDYFIETTKGNIIGQESDNKFGQNLAVGTSEEDIQSQGGTLIFLQSAELISISSDNAGDTLGGANATSVILYGLNENFTEISEIVNLSGATSVNTTQEFIRVNRMSVNEVGTYGFSNIGTITGVSAVSLTTQIEIPPGEGQSKTTHYTVPAGNNIILTALRITMDTGKEVDVAFKIRENADDITPPVKPIRTIRDFKGLSTPVSDLIKGNLKLDEKTDVWAVGITSIGTSRIEINFDFVKYAIGT
jgi:hypothetical protein